MKNADISMECLLLFISCNIKYIICKLQILATMLIYTNLIPCLSHYCINQWCEKSFKQYWQRSKNIENVYITLHKVIL